MAQIKLDKIDMRILAAVEEYGRMSKTALAEKVNLSALMHPRLMCIVASFTLKLRRLCFRWDWDYKLCARKGTERNGSLIAPN